MTESTGILRDGDVFAGYTVVRRLGAGGMGEVYLARHPRLPREDALKILGAVAAGDAQFGERFIREADIAANIDHPNVVAVHDRGVDGDRPWIAMSYIPGTDAQRRLAEAPAGLPTDEVEHIVAEVAEALDFTNGRGIAHRDVKPANILLSENLHRGRPRVYLADFGIARASGQSHSLTATSAFLGSLQYCAPEQITGQPSPHTDQYALAATAYHLLTGRPVFSGAHIGELLNLQLTGTPTPASDLRQGLSPQVDGVFARALAKSPEQRFSSCAGFADAFAAACTDRAAAQWAPTTLNPTPAAPAPTPPPQTLPPQTLPPTAPPIQEVVAPPQFATPTRTAAQWGWWLGVGGRELRGLAVAAPLLLGEVSGATVDLAARGSLRATRRELRDRWNLTEPAPGARLQQIIDDGWTADLVDPILTVLHQEQVDLHGDPEETAVDIYDRHPNLSTGAIIESVLVALGHRGIASSRDLPLSTVAWDCARSVQMVRQAVSAGFVDIASAWTLIAGLGDRAAVVYPSWETFAWGFELGAAVDVGHYHATKKAVRRSLDRTRPAMGGLLADPQGPWRTVPLR